MHALLLAAFLGGQSADLSTTVWKLRGSPVYAEANPLLPHTLPALVTVKAAAASSLCLLGWTLQRAHHPRLAALVYVAGAVSGTVAAVHNARLPQR